MRNHGLFATLIVAGLLALGGEASQAGQLVATDFEGFDTGVSVDGQNGWSASGNWDEEIVDDGTGNTEKRPAPEVAPRCGLPCGL